ncbi:ATP-grasp peptide maturase system methyltransferase [Nonomuraea bangladeshensis]|uniref:ATP-grasp peptide maturase system methyltransferase n=1 Tax=Nonomuraea bangladeshensis TaxID=404385 RepID=UPI0031DDF261
MNPLAATLRRHLAEEIGIPAWKLAVRMVPRELFVGDTIFRHGPSGWVRVRSSEMSSEEWLTLVYSDQPLVTQVAGVMADDDGDTSGVLRPTSSSTQPSLVVRMLNYAGIVGGDRVLEIGTGTGYSTALLCHRIGSRAVTSVEVDPAVAARAKTSLTVAGYTPTLVVGDGLDGYEERAPYDRLIATCAVRSIPPAWLRQVRPGGTITTPMLGWTGGAGLAHLRVAADGTASGGFGEPVFFMPARAHAAPRLDSMQLGGGDVTRTSMDPALLTSDMGLFVAQLGAPQAQHAWAEDILTLHDPISGSHADVRPSTDGGWVVHQYGPDRLWDEVEQALETWLDVGKPDRSGFTLAVSPERQTVTLVAAGASWDLPM